MIIPSSYEVSEHIIRLVDALASEIAHRFIVERVGHDQALHPADAIVRERVAHHARGVLRDWFLGDWTPERKP